MADVAVIIPWRPGCPHREAARSLIRSKWAEAHPGWEILEGTHVDGEWCKAAAISAAIDRTDADVFVLADADVWCETIPLELLRPDRWVVPHREVRRLDEVSTHRVLAGAPMGGTTLRVYDGHPGGGLVVLTREQWNAAPMDPRFRGWGGEDDAFALALTRLVGPPVRGDGILWHLWHPPQHKDKRHYGSEAGRALWGRYRTAVTPQQMRSLLDEALIGADA